LNEHEDIHLIIARWHPDDTVCLFFIFFKDCQNCLESLGAILLISSMKEEKNWCLKCFFKFIIFSHDFPFNCSEIKKGIKRLNDSKKEGTDLMLNEFIKTGNSTYL
jgi:hypothetical protein